MPGRSNLEMVQGLRPEQRINGPVDPTSCRVRKGAYNDDVEALVHGERKGYK